MSAHSAAVLDSLHPAVAGSFTSLEAALTAAYQGGSTTWWFRPFEGYRSPQRQTAAILKRTTRARAFESAHQYGLAVDFVPYLEKKGYHWPDANEQQWDFLRITAKKFGLLNDISWDRPHVWHPIWDKIQPHVVVR